jgi:hypothetical protein
VPASNRRSDDAVAVELDTRGSFHTGHGQDAARRSGRFPPGSARSPEHRLDELLRIEIFARSQSEDRRASFSGAGTSAARAPSPRPRRIAAASRASDRRLRSPRDGEDGS